MKIITSLTVISVIAIAGCTPRASITQPPVPYQLKRQLPAGNFHGDDQMVVRTLAKKKDGTKEVIGAACTFETSYTNSSFKTPAHVVTPNLAKVTPIGHLKCSDGTKETAQNLEPFNKTLAERVRNAKNSGNNAGLIGALVGGIAAGVVGARGDRPGDVFGYSDTEAVLDYTAAASTKDAAKAQ